LIGATSFSKAGRDRYVVAGFIPNESKVFNPLNKEITFDVAGALTTFKIDAKGRGKTASGRFAMKLKYTRNKATKKKEFVGGPIPFTVRVSKGSWAAIWKERGFNPKLSIKKGSLPVVVDMTLSNTIYTSGPLCRYDSKAEKTARFRFVAKKVRK
jgi:hypothetical protein